MIFFFFFFVWHVLVLLERFARQAKSSKVDSNSQKSTKSKWTCFSSSLIELVVFARGRRQSYQRRSTRLVTCFCDSFIFPFVRILLVGDVGERQRITIARKGNLLFFKFVLFKFNFICWFSSLAACQQHRLRFLAFLAFLFVFAVRCACVACASCEDNLYCIFMFVYFYLALAFVPLQYSY